MIRWELIFINRGKSNVQGHKNRVLGSTIVGSISILMNQQVERKKVDRKLGVGQHS